MKTVPAEWQTAILICKKCSKKVGGGFGEKGRTSLAKALRARGNGKKGRKADFGIIETGCLKVCPKNAVVAIDAAHPRQWLVVPAGADMDEVAQRLGIENDDQLSPP
ncbi:MAG: (2Fe-2S) ferredoxin domain-containing protein [Sphingobium sp.]